MIAETSSCVEKGQTVNVSLLAFPRRTYEFSILVENTGKAVLSELNLMLHKNYYVICIIHIGIVHSSLILVDGTFSSGVSQNGT